MFVDNHSSSRILSISSPAPNKDAIIAEINPAIVSGLRI